MSFGRRRLLSVGDEADANAAPISFASEPFEISPPPLAAARPELRAAVETYARDLASLSQTSIRGAKRIVDAGSGGAQVDLRALIEAAALDEDFREGRAAFAARRKPTFG